MSAQPPSSSDRFASLTLRRRPDDPSLRAWSAADELAYDRLHEASPEGPVLLIGDAFGALAVAALSLVPELYWWSDSAVAHRALEENLSANGVSPERVRVLSSLDAAPPCAVVIIALPKSTRFLSAIFAQVTRFAEEVWVAAMVRHVSAGARKAISQAFDVVEPGRAIKKARVVRLREPRSGLEVGSPRERVIEPWGFSVVNLPGSYAESSVDAGALCLLAYVDAMPKMSRVIDLGCGNAILALAYATQNPGVRCVMVDESRQGVESARLGWERSGFEAEHAEFCWQDGVVPGQRAELILCNPPFHQRVAQTTAVAHDLFKQAAGALEEEGELWVVGNRHLGYHVSLREDFRDVQVMSSHPKFVVLRARRPRSG